jgi:alpha-L-rhamnosidase
MRKNYLLFFLLIFIVTVTKAQVKVQNLLCENRTNPTGLDVQQPRFSWQLVSEQRNVSQTAYEIIVSSGKTTVWKSGKVMSDRSVHVPYAGTALQSGKKYTWEVRVWDNNGKPSPLSEPAFFQTALLSVCRLESKMDRSGFEEDSITGLHNISENNFLLLKKLHQPQFILLHMACMKRR